MFIAILFGVSLALSYMWLNPEAPYFETSIIFIGAMIACLIDDVARALRDIAKRGLR